MKEVLLYSGGMDSYIAWHYLNKPKTLFVNLKHRYNLKEVSAVKKTIPETIIFNGLDLGKFEKSDADIPLRNLYLAMIAVSEGFEKIWLVVQKDETSIPDRTPEFFKSASEVLSELAEKEIIVDSPFMHMDKTDMTIWYKENVGDIEALDSTVGCYNEDYRHCGNCGACLRRWVAFSNAGIKPDYDLKPEIKKFYLDKISSYSADRKKRLEILKNL